MLIKAARERDFTDELESHLQRHIDDNISAGMSPQEARRFAVMKLGGIDQAKEAYRDRATIPFLESVVQDLLFTVRQLRKNPAFTVTASIGVIGEFSSRTPRRLIGSDVCVARGVKSKELALINEVGEYRR